MRFINSIILLVIILTVNDAKCVNVDNNDENKTTNKTTESKTINDSCVVYNVNSISDIREQCKNQTTEEATFNLIIKKSIFNEFPKIFQFFTNLHSVDITNGGIQHIHTTTFNNAIHLTTLFLSGSHLVNLTNYLFAHTNNLTSLDLTNSNIENIEKNAFSGLSNLRRLDLSSNNIKHLDDDVFKPLIRLETIRLIFNKIEKINGNLFTRNTGLKWAYFSSNDITIVEQNAFISTKLIELDLGNNKLNELDLINYKHLKTLSIDHNKVNVINVPSLLENLHAENNQIIIINSDDKNELKKLYLANNHLINPRNLSNFIKLEYLDLSSNHFKNFNFSNLINLEKLKQLNLIGNKLQQIDFISIVTTLPNLAMIELSTLHWPNDYVNQLEEALHEHKIYLNQDRNTINDDNDTVILIPPSSSSTITISTLPILQSTSSDIVSATSAPTPTNIVNKLHEILDKMNNLNIHMNESDSSNKSKFDVLFSSQKTFEILLTIIFVIILTFIIYQLIIFVKKFLNSMRYRRARSTDPIFSEQDL